MNPPNYLGNLLSLVCDELQDLLTVKFGPHWPVVVVHRGLLPADEARTLRRSLRTLSRTRRASQQALNIAVMRCQKLGVESEILRSLPYYRPPA